jgi:small basic protein
MIFVVILALAVGIVVGAFSHKWLAAEVKSVSGVDAQAAADALKKKI